MTTPGGGNLPRAVLTSLAVAAAALLLFVALCAIPAERVESLLWSDAQVRPLLWTLSVGQAASLPSTDTGLLQA